MSKMKLALDVVQDLRNLADSIEALADATLLPAIPATPDVAPIPATPSSSATPITPAPATPAEPQQPGDSPKLSLVELRAFVAEKSIPENRPKIKAILDRFGVKKLTELSEDQYPALIHEVEAL